MGKPLGTIYYYSLYKIKFKAMPILCVTFVLLFNDSNKSDSCKDDYDSDFENTPDLDKHKELPLDEEIILLEDNNDPSDDNEPKEGTSFVDIEEFLTELILIEPPELPPAKIPEIPSTTPKPKAKNYYNDRTQI
jgi:hypothetical protein